MSLVVATEPPSLVAVHEQCAAIEEWAERCESVPELRDVTNRLAAIDEYLNRTSKEGRGRVAAAMRRLEVRIGTLLGPPMTPSEAGAMRGVDRDQPLPDVDRKTKADFRQMAEHQEVVEDVIARSSDEAPASRRSVMERIREAKAKHPVPTGTGKSRAEMQVKIDKAIEMAEAGHTSRQIADALGYATVETFRSFCRSQGISVPADAVIGKARTHDSNRIVEQAAISLEGLAMSLDLVAAADLDPERIEQWAASFESSVRSLNRFTKHMKETARGHQQ